MNKIEAYIKPHKASDVTMALQKLEELPGMSITDVRGFGRRAERDVPHPKIDDLIDFAAYTRIEIFCTDDMVEEIVSTIEQAAHTGLRGDGKIYLTPVRTAIRIGDGERGDKAV